MEYRRHVLGVLAVALGVAAVWMNWIEPTLADEYPQFASASMRLALLFGVLWIAMPDVMRGPAVLIFLLTACVAVAVLFKSGKHGLRIIVPAMGVLALLSFLRRFTAGRIK